MLGPRLELFQVAGNSPQGLDHKFDLAAVGSAPQNAGQFHRTGLLDPGHRLTDEHHLAMPQRDHLLVERTDPSLHLQFPLGGGRLGYPFPDHFVQLGHIQGPLPIGRR